MKLSLQKNPNVASDRRVIRLVAVIEAVTVTGPAKNLIEFARRAQTPSAGLPAVALSIVTFQRGNGSSNAFVSAARQAGGEIDVLHERFRFDPRVIGQLREIVERRSPDILQTHNVKSHFLVRFSGIGRRCPWIAFHHGYTSTDLKMLLYNQLDRCSLPSARREVTVCRAFADQLARRGVRPERIQVLHNSVAKWTPPQQSEIDALRTELGIAPGTRVVLAVGRFSREKAQIDAIGALAALRRQAPDLPVVLLLVGEGPERTHLEAAARALALQEQVLFAGQRSRVAPFYALADALVLSSHSEGSPNVLLEAMAAGLPVAATSVGGVPEIATHERTALLAPPAAPEQLSAALLRLLTDRDLAAGLAANAAALVAAHYSPEAYYQSLVELYRDFLTAEAPR